MNVRALLWLVSVTVSAPPLTVGPPPPTGANGAGTVPGLGQVYEVGAQLPTTRDEAVVGTFNRHPSPGTVKGGSDGPLPGHCAGCARHPGAPSSNSNSARVHMTRIVPVGTRRFDRRWLGTVLRLGSKCRALPQRHAGRRANRSLSAMLGVRSRFRALRARALACGAAPRCFSRHAAMPSRPPPCTGPRTLHGSPV